MAERIKIHVGSALTDLGLISNIDLGVGNKSRYNMRGMAVSYTHLTSYLWFSL